MVLYLRKLERELGSSSLLNDIFTLQQASLSAVKTYIKILARKNMPQMEMKLLEP